MVKLQRLNPTFLTFESLDAADEAVDYQQEKRNQEVLLHHKGVVKSQHFEKD
jgi:hypothetical protein